MTNPAFRAHRREIITIETLGLDFYLTKLFSSKVPPKLWNPSYGSIEQSTRASTKFENYSPGVGKVVRGDENVSRSSPALSNDEEKRETEIL